MKRIIAILMCLIFFISGCSKSENISSDNVYPESAQNETYILPDEPPYFEIDDANSDISSKKSVPDSQTNIEKPSQTDNINDSAKAKNVGSNDATENVIDNNLEVSEQPNENNLDIPIMSPNNEAAPITSPNNEAAIQQKDCITLSITGVGEQTDILPPTEIDFKENDTVFSVLLATTKANKIHMDFSGTSSTAYVMGIDNLYEYDKGEASGWIYSVNGEFPNQSCGGYRLNKGDVIEWIYTENMRKDSVAGF